MIFTKQRTSSFVSAGTAADKNQPVSKSKYSNVSLIYRVFLSQLVTKLSDRHFPKVRVALYCHWIFKWNLRISTNHHIRFEIVDSQFKDNKIIWQKTQAPQKQCFVACLVAQICRTFAERKMSAVLWLSGQNRKPRTKPSVLLRTEQASEFSLALEVGHLSLMQLEQRGACHFDRHYVNC